MTDNNSAQKKKRRLSNKKFLFILIVVGIVAGSLFLGRYFYLQVKYPHLEVIKSVPESAIAVIEAQSVEHLNKSLLGVSFIQHYLKKDSATAGLLEAIALLSSKVDDRKELKYWLNEAHLFVSIIATKDNRIEPLISLQGKRRHNPKKLLNAIKTYYPEMSKQRVLEIEFYRISGEIPVMFTIHKGIVLIALNREALELGYYTIDSGLSIDKDDYFVKVYDYLQKSLNKQPGLYFSYRKLYRWWSRLLTEEHKTLLTAMPNFGHWSAMEINTEQQKIVLQGYTNFKDDPSSYSALLGITKKNSAATNALIPVNTGCFKREPVTPFEVWRKAYFNQFLRKTPGKGRTYSIPASTIDSLTNIFSFYLKDELLTGVVEPFDDIPGSNFYLMAPCDDPKSFYRTLQPFVLTDDTLAYQSVVVRQFKSRYLVPAMLGSRFHAFENAWFAFVGDFLLVTNNKSTMLSVLNNIVMGNNLSSNPDCRALLTDIPNENHLSYYIDFQQSFHWLKSTIDSTMHKRYEKAYPLFPAKALVAFSVEKDILITDIVLYMPQDDIVESKKTEVLLPDELTLAPVIIDDHRTNGKKILVFCKNKTVSLIDVSGHIEWQMSVEELPLSDIFRVNLFRNNKYQYLFLGERKVHIIALDGTYVNGFPAGLPVQNKGYGALFDYEGNGNYRIIYGSSDKVLHNVSVNGEPVAGWVKPVMYEVLASPPKHLVLNNKDYIVVVDTAQTPYFFDRRGLVRINTIEPVAVGRGSEITIMKNEVFDGFVFLDPAGRLTMINEAGVTEKHELLKFNSSAVMKVFGYNSKKELIFLSNGEMKVYDESLKLKAVHANLPAAVKNTNMVISPDGRYLVFGADATNNDPFVVLDNGQTFIHSQYSGEKITYGWLTRSGNPGVTFAKGKILKIIPLIE